MNILCVIPARSGSQRIPGKNLRKLAGNSLVRIAYDAAVSSGVFKSIYVSTDDQLMADGCPWIERPIEISQASSDISEASKHALITAEKINDCKYDYVVTLQPAIPLRTGALIKNLVENVIKNKCSGGVTGVETVPWLWSEQGGAAKNSWTPEPYPRSQSFKGQHLWQEINAVQMASREVALQGKRWDLPLLIQLMPPFAIIDIDEPEDLESAQQIFPLLQKALEISHVDKCIVINTINKLNHI